MAATLSPEFVIVATSDLIFCKRLSTPVVVQANAIGPPDTNPMKLEADIELELRYVRKVSKSRAWSPPAETGPVAGNMLLQILKRAK
jgi:hypothetical protein